MNNPLKYSDPSGYLFRELFFIAAITVAPTYYIVGMLCPPYNLSQFKQAWRDAKNSADFLYGVGVDLDNRIINNISTDPKTTTTKPKPSRTTGEDPYSMPCFSQEGDVILQGFPDQFDAQNNPNICFTTSMEYLSIFYGGTRRREEYGSYYMMSNQDLSYYSRGITDLQKGKTLLSTFFNNQEITPQEITKSIDAGNPVMTTIYTGSTVENGETIENYHSVVIIGYNYNDCTYIIVDPYTGQWARVTASSVEDKNLYTYQIYGMKPE